MDWKALKKLPDVHIQGPDRENYGRAYSNIFTQLQIRPEQHERFLDSNLRSFRNKDTDLIAKGDDEPLEKRSEICLTAIGNLMWGKERQWLLRKQEPEDGEQPLEYSQPPDQKKVITIGKHVIKS